MSSCFHSCFDCIESGLCMDRCGNVNGTLPGFVVETCQSTTDSCVWIEYLHENNEQLFSVTTPYGCLTNFYTKVELLSDDFSDAKFSEGVSIFSCSGNLCNLPPEKASCGETDAQNFTEGGEENDCSLNEFELFCANYVRSGFIEEELDLRGRCLDFSETEQQAMDIKEFKLLEPDSVLQEVNTIICDNCVENVNCLEDGTTSSPGPDGTNSPTLDPALDDPNSGEDILDEDIFVILVVLTLVSLGAILMFVKRQEMLRSRAISVRTRSQNSDPKNASMTNLMLGSMNKNSSNFIAIPKHEHSKETLMPQDSVKSNDELGLSL